MTRCQDKCCGGCAAADGNNRGRSSLRRGVDDTVGDQLVGGESASFVEEAVRNFACEGDAEGLDAHDANLQRVSCMLHDVIVALWK